MLERVDLEYPLSSNPLDLSEEPDYSEDSVPDTLTDNEYFFVNEEINDPPLPENIATTRADWESFLEGLNPESVEEPWSSEVLDYIVEPEQYYTKLALDVDDLDDQIVDDDLSEFEEDMSWILYDADDFYGIFPTDLSYEDPQDHLKSIDDGSSQDLTPRWLRMSS